MRDGGMRLIKSSDASSLGSAMLPQQEGDEAAKRAAAPRNAERARALPRHPCHLAGFHRLCSMAAAARLQAERKDWRKEHPPHMVAKPANRPDGTANLLEWDIKVPGKPGSVWAPGLFSGKMYFTEDYPNVPPKVKFDKIKGEPLFHPNVYTDGGVCLSIINPEGSTHAYGSGGTWKPSMNLKTVMTALQIFLDEATSRAGGREEAYRLYNHDRKAYDKRVKQQVAAVEHYDE